MILSLQSCRRLRRALVLICLYLAAFSAGMTASSAQAQVTSVNCYVTGSTYFDFGAVNLFSGNLDNVMSLSYTCGANASPSGVAYVRLCVDLESGTGGNSFSPRLMNASGSSLTLKYNFFADAARTIVIGSDNSGNFSPLSTTISIPVSQYYAATSGTINLYTRIFGGQGVNLSSPYLNYNSNFPGSQSELKYAWSSSTTPQNCTSSGTSHVHLDLQVQAHIQSGCFISTTTDLDFGQTSGVIASNKDQSSYITIACSGNSAWQVSLNNGAHYANGMRNMAGPGGSLISYQLYRDQARTQVWGSTLNTNTVSGSGGASTQLTVYGRVPPQNAPPAGAYSDSIIVNLTY
ncbi:spore coat U domain-containing protein [Caballeronia calidae]|uniref:Spore coat U domain-containing protein n=1 Tax=Caballeronia calidae TaxID=1777139 RepID=A0A158EHR5_9BURK|nr:spore coat U domain-containing protein [Caballeronia calidae]SAL06240.1 spore coat U domain-containing protein [Caballeronia calidae]